MKTKFSIALIAIFLLAACTPKVAPTPAGTLPPIEANTTSEPLSGTVDIKIASFAFSPAEVTIKVGTTVNWTNEDTATHTVVASDNSFSSGDLGKGDVFTFTFSQAGTFDYRCGIHANMTGKIIVVP